MTPQRNDYSTLQFFLDGLMKRYMERVPDVEMVMKHLLEEQLIDSPQTLQNDHIAFRTMGVPHLGIASMEKIFLHHGYERKDYLFFEEKKLNAYWYHPPRPHFPRVFISELRVADLSPQTQALITKYTQVVTSDPVDALDLDNGAAIDQFLHSGLWQLPTYQDYQTLSQESEYAAWVIYNRYYLNHFTISIHDLKKHNHIEVFNDWLESKGIILNNAGGKIKKSPDGLLLQSSTVAAMIKAEFAGGDVHKISGSYVEFADRRVLPQYAHLNPQDIKREHRRDGFESKNADKIFESTFNEQTQRR